MVCLAGCQGRENLDLANEAWAQGDAQRAVTHFETAFRHQPSFAKDASVQSAYALARSRVSFDQAEIYRQGCRYRESLDAYELAAELDPTDARIAPAIQQVRQEAVAWRYERAVVAAAVDDLPLARLSLKAGLEFVSNHEPTHRALALLDASSNTNAVGIDTMRRARAQAKMRHWQEVIPIAEQAFEQNADWLEALALKARAQHQMDHSVNQLALARADAKKHQLGPAIDKLNDAINTWAGHEEAVAEHTRVVAIRHEALSLNEQAVQAADNQDWDAAIRLAAESSAVDQSDRVLKDTATAMPRVAATWLVARGDEVLVTGDRSEAESQYARALGYDPDHTAANQGMAKIFAQRGEGFAQGGQRGIAAVAYAVSLGHASIPKTRDAYNQSLVGLWDQWGQSGVAMLVAPPSHPVHASAVSAREFEQAMAEELDPRLLRQTPAASGDAVTASLGYRLEVDFVDAGFSTRLVSRRSLSHPYSVERWAINPAYVRAERAHRRAVERYRNASSGSMAKPNWQHQYKNKEGESQEEAQRRRRQRQRKHQEHQRHLQSLKSAMDSAYHQLRCTPHQILVLDQYQWPYTKETHEKVGLVTACFKLVSIETGEAVDAWDVSVKTRDTDSMNMNANPSIGLHVNPLVLEGDEFMRRKLMRQLGSEAAQRTSGSTLKDRAWRLNQMAHHLRAGGREQEAVEVFAAAIIAEHRQFSQATRRKIAALWHGEAVAMLVEEAVPALAE